MKPCTKCEVVKPLDGFNLDVTHPDGRSSVCKGCRSAEKRRLWALRYELMTPEEIAADNAKRRLATKRYAKRNPERTADAKRRQNIRRRPKAILAQKRHRAKYPLEIKARAKAANAIAAGKIKRLPCEVCGNEKADAHHDDYNQPLVVRFLCRKHHSQWHRTVPRLKIGGVYISPSGNTV